MKRILITSILALFSQVAIAQQTVFSSSQQIGLSQAPNGDIWSMDYFNGYANVFSPYGNLRSVYNVGYGATAPAFTKDGRTAFIANEYGLDFKAINTTTGQIKYTITVGNDHAYEVPSVYINHGKGYVLYGNLIDTFNPKNGKIFNTITTDGTSLRSLNFSKNGKFGVVLDDKSNQLDVVNLNKGKVIKEISFGNMPRDEIWKRNHVYAVNFNNGTVSDINLRSSAITAIPVGINPRRIISCGGNLCVSNNDSASISVINPRTDKVVRTIPTNTTPFGMVMHNHRLLVANSMGVQQFNLKNRSNNHLTTNYKSNRVKGANIDVMFTLLEWRF